MSGHHRTSQTVEALSDEKWGKLDDANKRIMQLDAEVKMLHEQRDRLMQAKLVAEDRVSALEAELQQADRVNRESINTIRELEAELQQARWKALDEAMMAIWDCEGVNYAYQLVKELRDAPGAGTGEGQ